MTEQGWMGTATVHPEWRGEAPFDQRPTRRADTQTHPGGKGRGGQEVNNRRVTLPTGGPPPPLSFSVEGGFKTGQTRGATTWHPYGLTLTHLHRWTRVICEKPFFLFVSPDEGRGPGFFSWGVSAAQSATLRHATAPPLWAVGDRNNNNSSNDDVDSLTHWCCNPRLSGGLTPLG